MVRRHTAILLHPPRSGVIGRQGFDHIEVIALQQFAQITRASLYIGLRIERIGDAQI